MELGGRRSVEEKWGRVGRGEVGGKGGEGVKVLGGGQPQEKGRSQPPWNWSLWREDYGQTEIS